MMTIWLSNLIAQKYVILNIQGFLCNWQGPGCNWQQDRKGRVCISPEKAWERPLPVDYDSWRWYGEVYLEVIFFFYCSLTILTSQSWDSSNESYIGQKTSYKHYIDMRYLTTTNWNIMTNFPETGEQLTGLTENKTKSASWGLATLENLPSKQIKSANILF